MWFNCPGSSGQRHPTHPLDSGRQHHSCGNDSGTFRVPGRVSWRGPGSGLWGCGLPGFSPLWAPEVMALDRGPVMLLTLSLGLASAQKTLEEVPLQSDFDAQKVTAARVPDLALRQGHGCTCHLEAVLKGGGQDTKGKRQLRGEGPRHSLPGSSLGQLNCPGRSGVSSSCRACHWLWASGDPACPHPSLWGTWMVQGPESRDWRLWAPHSTGPSPTLATCIPAGGGTLADHPAGHQPYTPGLPRRPLEARSPFHLDPGQGPGVCLVLDVSMVMQLRAGAHAQGPSKRQ